MFFSFTFDLNVDIPGREQTRLSLVSENIEFMLSRLF